VESNAPKYKVGSVWPDNTIFDDLGENCVVRARSGGRWGETVKFSGPESRGIPGGGRGKNQVPPC
jgi:hypothetical protein